MFWSLAILTDYQFAPGKTIRFAVSSLAKTNYQATLFRSISSDPNPEGPGIVELNADEYFKPVNLPSRHQSIKPGSYGETAQPLSITVTNSMKLSVSAFSSLLSDHLQTIVSWGPLRITLDGKGYVSLYFGHGRIAWMGKSGIPPHLSSWQAE